MWRSPGDGWVTCRQGHRHWGTHGAAGLLVTRLGAHGRPEVMLQHRAAWTHQGDTWGLAGGARRPEESPEQTALREAGEEIGLRPESVRVSAVSSDEHGGWSYETVVAEALEPELVDLAAADSRHETEAVAWLDVSEVTAIRLHPGFRASWEQVSETLAAPTLLVDAANVVGSRPNGWWRDRVGANRDLLRSLDSLARVGVERHAAPWHSPVLLRRWYPRVVVVVEGAPARELAEADLEQLSPRVRVLRTSGGQSGDDLLHAYAATRSPAEAFVAADRSRPVVAVTADRALRERLAAAQVSAVGPRWLWAQLDG